MSEKKFNPAFADVLLSENRKQMLPPKTIIDYLNINADDTVVDLGCGNGYFTIPIAKKQPYALYAVDIEPKMLELLQERAQLENFQSIEYVRTSLEDTGLAANSAAKVLLSLVLHEVENLDQVIKEAQRLLKPAGQMLIIEWKAVASKQGPPLHERISSYVIEGKLHQENFETAYIDLNESQYGLIASKSLKKSAVL